MKKQEYTENLYHLDEGQGACLAFYELVHAGHAGQFLLFDENTYKHCAPYLFEQLPELAACPALVLPAGEEYKNLQTCQRIWQFLQEQGASRKSLLWIVGGGVLGDMGGFAASCYKRGIDYVFLPTTLLAQVDASLGGKLGIDFEGLKNQLGLFGQALALGMDRQFLSTLDKRQWRSGQAEMLKHALLAGQGQLGQFLSLPEESPLWLEQLLPASLAIKAAVVARDPFEAGERKILNLGHSLGHAIESRSLVLGGAKQLLHGEAIAWGLVLALWLSVQHRGLDEAVLQDVLAFVRRNYAALDWRDYSYPELANFLRADKKNSSGKLLFVLLPKPGQAQWDCALDEQDVEAALLWAAREL